MNIYKLLTWTFQNSVRNNVSIFTTLKYTILINNSVLNQEITIGTIVRQFFKALS